MLVSHRVNTVICASFQAAPFVLEVFTDSCDAKLKVVALEAGGSQLEGAVCDAAVHNVNTPPSALYRHEWACRAGPITLRPVLSIFHLPQSSCAETDGVSCRVWQAECIHVQPDFTLVPLPWYFNTSKNFWRNDL